MPLNEGDLFAGYTIVRLLGSGGMGEVYLAQHPRLPRRDALKVLPAALTADHEYRERFNREADVAAELWHPHIVGIHDRGEFEGQLWLSMDYVEGTDAAELLRSRYPSGMPENEVFDIITAVADALDYAHLRGLLHRDVKPANILLTDADPRERRVLLADFGIARQLGDISGLTATNMVVGTTAYSAPEQLMGQDLDGRADQYALGCTAFHLLAGSALYQNSNPAVVITQHLSAPPPKIGERRPELADLDPVLAKVLAKERDDRYPNCSDFAAALSGRPSDAALDTVDAAAAMAATSRAPAASAPTKEGRRLLRPALLISAIATVVVITVGVVVGLPLLHRHPNQPSSGATTAPTQPSSSAAAAPTQPSSAAPAPPGPSIQLAKYVTDQSGVLGAPGLAAVNHALSNLYNQRNIHLWVAYVNDFGGVTPFRWAESTMAANGFTNTDALLAIATGTRSFAFRVPTAMTGGTNLTVVEVEQIRRDQIAPAVANGEWARAAVLAAEGLNNAAQ